MNKSTDGPNVTIEIKIWQTEDGLKIVEFMRTEGPAHDYYTYVREVREEYFEHTSDIQLVQETQMVKTDAVMITEKTQAKPQQHMNEQKNFAKPQMFQQSLNELAGMPKTKVEPTF